MIIRSRTWPTAQSTQAHTTKEDDGDDGWYENGLHYFSLFQSKAYKQVGMENSKTPSPKTFLNIITNHANPLWIQWGWGVVSQDSSDGSPLTQLSDPEATHISLSLSFLYIYINPLSFITQSNLAPSSSVRITSFFLAPYLYPICFQFQWQLLR